MRDKIYALLKSNLSKSKEHRRKLEITIRGIMALEPYIGVNEIHRRIGGSQYIISDIFMKIRREDKRNRMNNINILK